MARKELPSKWDQRYHKAFEPGEVAAVLKDNLHLLPADGQALDLACGLGANALTLAKQGLQTQAWDSSALALEKLKNFSTTAGFEIATQCRDVEKTPPAANSFDVIVVSRFLFRPICDILSAALRPGGLLFYQTFTAAKISDAGPSNTNFLLKKAELLSLFSDLDVLSYREEADCGNLASGLRNEAYLVGRKRR